jgi:hypothetical protein
MTEPAGPKLVWERDSRFTFEDYDDTLPSTKPWLIKNAWPMRGVAWVAGASGAAKTFFTLDAALKIAGGSEVIWGRRAQSRGVVYVAAEDADGCRGRVRAWRRTKGAKAVENGRRLPFKLVPQALDLLNPTDVEDFIAAAAGIGDEWAEAGSPLGLVCIDTFSVCIPGADENNGADMSRALEALYRISKELDVLVVVVAHFGKSGSQGSIRGWSGLGYNADGLIVLERGDPIKDQDPQDRFVSFQKVKNGVDGGRLQFRLQEVDLGMIDEAGDPMTSCIVRFEKPSQEPAKRGRKKAPQSPGARIIVRAFNQLLEVGQTYVVPPVPGVPPNTVGIARTDLRDHAVKLDQPSKDLEPDPAKRSINRDISALIADETLREFDDIIWRPASNDRS